MVDNLALITSFLFPIRAAPNGAGEMEKGVMQHCVCISNVCILSVSTCTAVLLVGPVCSSVCVFTGVWKRRLPCDDEMFLYMSVDVFGE